MSAKTIFFILLAISILQKEVKKDKEKDIPSPTIKNFILRYNKKLDENTAEEIAKNIVHYSNLHNVDAKLITALIARESRFNSAAVSTSGAMGLGQLIPSTAKEVGVEDPFNIEQNIKGTVLYFKKMLDIWKGHPQQIDLALASYRIGHKTVKQYQGVPPILDVPEFVENVKQIYGKI